MRNIYKMWERLHKFILRKLNYANTDFDSNGENWLLQSLHKLSSDPLTIFDVGANKGDYTFLCNRSLTIRNIPHQIFAFEPNNDNYVKLVDRFSGNKAIQIEKYGIGEKTTESELIIPLERNSLASIFSRDIEHFKSDNIRIDKIMIESIDNFMSNNRIHKIDFLKIDIEGNELSAIKGATKALDNKRISLIQFEFGGTMIDSRTFFRDIFDFLNSKGYRLGRLMKNRIYWYDNYSEIYEQFTYANYVALPQKSHITL